jgi:hypothetical protein
MRTPAPAQPGSLVSPALDTPKNQRSSCQSYADYPEAPLHGRLVDKPLPIPTEAFHRCARRYGEHPRFGGSRTGCEGAPTVHEGATGGMR